MWRVVLPQNNQTEQLTDGHRRLLIPLALVVFLLLATVLSVTTLFLKYRIEHARTFSANALRARVGVDFGFDALHTEGLRSLQVNGLRLEVPVPGLGQVALNAEKLRLTLSLSELFRGRAVIGRVEIGGARLVIDATAKTARRPGGGASGGGINPEKLLAMVPPIELSGDHCSMEYRQASGRAPMILEDISFRFSNNPDTDEARIQVAAALTQKEAVATLSVEGTYRLPDFLDTTIEIRNVTPAHLHPVVAVPEGIDGLVSLRLRGYGMLKKQVFADLAVSVSEAVFPQAPAGIEPVSAELSALAQWDAATNEIRLLNAELNSPLASASAQGSLDLTQQPPGVDATATIGSIPVETLLAAYLPESVARMGEMSVDVSPDTRINVRVSGALDAPRAEVRVALPAVSAAMVPADKKLPSGRVRIEQVNLVWSDFSGMPTGTANLVDGEITATAFGVKAEALAGTATFDGNALSVRPITAMISDKPWSGAATYDLSRKELAFDVNGALTKIEDTPLHDLVKKLWLGGEIAVRGRGTLGPDGRLKLRANADVTKGMVAFEWWLRKPVGVGASIHNIEVDMIPGKSLAVKGEAAIEDTRIIAELDYGYGEGKFQQKRIRVDIPHLEVNSAGKCVQIPYTALGGACRDAYYESNWTGDKYGDDIAKIGGHFDYVSFLPEGGENPLVCHDAEVQVTLTDIKGVERSAALTVHAGEAHVPPFGDDWLLPLGPSDPDYDDGSDPEEEQPPQPWTYTLSADKIFVPPWEGSNFSAELYSNEEETGFKFFRADSGNGHLEGTYLHEKEDNIMHLEATWDSIPATYIIRHLELPEVLAGDISGNIVYVVDQDDPRTTMRADGAFSVKDGHFIPEQLAFMLSDTLGSSFISLHPDALAFKEVSSKVRIEGDQIHTPDLVMDSEGMRITGHGVWVMEGDLDYRINVAITPDLADQIPMLRDYFNVQGFRMTQQNIELGFQLTGPTFQPTGQLAGLPPIGVTIVSGAAEMTGEAFRLLDTPRQIFMSIFRIGGGIIGATRTQQQQPQ